MKRILGIGLVLALVVSGLVVMSNQSERPRAGEAQSAAQAGDSAGQRVAPPDVDEGERGEGEEEEDAQQGPAAAPIVPPVITTPEGSAAVEQTTHGAKPGPVLVESFDGLGVGFTGPQGTANLRNPSDNTLAVGPNHIVQIVNTSDGHLHEEGEEVRDHRARALRPGAHGELLQGLRRPVRGDQQR